MVRGARAHAEAEPSLLVEVPHGADRQEDYDRLARRLRGPLPERLERFFHVNTDVGAWDLGLAIARSCVRRRPEGVAVAVRCLIPRTFVDTNRVIDAAPGAGLTPGMAPYVSHGEDQALLRGLHAAYVETVAAWMERVVGGGGLAVIPHTYAPRTVPVERVDERIVLALEEAYRPEVLAQAPLRPEVDLLTCTPEGVDLAPPGVARRVLEGLRAVGIDAQENTTYQLHPSTWGARWASRYPGRVFTFEVRRDLVTAWEPFVAKRVRREEVERIAEVVGAALG